MPSIQSPLGALPRRFRRPRVLIVGCGDVGQRVLPLLRHSARVFALTTSADKITPLRTAGASPLLGNLDHPPTLRRLAGMATHVLHLAPPLSTGSDPVDRRTQALLQALRQRSRPAVLVYGSTSGVYGDCGGAVVDERRGVHPQTARALLRVSAEDEVTGFGWNSVTRTCILRIPGIYAPNRPGGTPHDRLLRGTPVLRPDDDVYTNHIHADDLASACRLALWRVRGKGVFNVNDDTRLKMGDYFDLAADTYRLPRPPRITRAEAKATLSPLTLSFMSESRRMDNTRIKGVLGFTLCYPTVVQGL